MRAKSEKRVVAEQLRMEQGLSYSEISILTGIKKSTLSGWLKDIPLSKEQTTKLKEKMEANRQSFAYRAWIVNRNRHERARELAIEAGKEIFYEIPHHRSVDELSLAMLYLGEGSKSYGRVQIANTQSSVLLYFLTMLKHLYQVDEKRLSFRLNLVSAVRQQESEYIYWWKNELKSPNARFLKTQYDSRSRASYISLNYHGVCTITYCDTYLQQRLISLANTYILAHA